MKFSEVTAEIRAVIESLDEGPKDIGALTSRVLANHPNVSGVDADFHLCCSFRAVRHEVRQQLNRTRPDDTIAAQLSLAGFEHLQGSYDIERDGSEKHVPIAEATDEELLAKADAYDAQSAAMREHASELRRYVVLRASASQRPAVRPHAAGPELGSAAT